MADLKKQLDNENQAYLASVIDECHPDSEEDVLVLTLHATLLRNGFKIISAGNVDEDFQPGSPLDGLGMPNGWNKQHDPDCYLFTYVNVNDGQLYSVRALRIEEKIYISLLGKDESEKNAAEIRLNVSDEVQRGKKPVTIDWLSNFPRLWRHIEENLFVKIQGKHEKESSSLKETKADEHKEPKSNSETTLLERRPMTFAADSHFPEPPHPSLHSQEEHLPRAPPFAFGDADRLPGHPGMGGMLMDPLRSGGMGLRPPSFPRAPRGSVPPGARFDPYGPLTEFDHRTGSRVPRRSFEPNPDHLRRPGFDDDMFM